MSTNTPTEFEGRLSAGKDWREIVAWVGDLPPMPQVASRAIALIEDPEVTAKQLTDVLAKDTALTVRVLKIANSAMFSRQREITTLNQAIMLIGFKALKGVIVAAALRQMTKASSKIDSMVWENAMATAMSATRVALRLKKPYVEEIFLLGMLHTLGQVVLLAQPDTTKVYKEVLDTIKKSACDYVTAEQDVYGFSHPLIGALVAKKWNFSPDTCQIILHYRDQLDGQERPETPVEEKAALIQLADMLVHMAGIGSPEGYPDQAPRVLQVATYLGMNAAAAPNELQEVVDETRAQFDSERHLYE